MVLLTSNDQRCAAILEVESGTVHVRWTRDVVVIVSSMHHTHTNLQQNTVHMLLLSSNKQSCGVSYTLLYFRSIVIVYKFYVSILTCCEGGGHSLHTFRWGLPHISRVWVCHVSHFPPLLSFAFNLQSAGDPQFYHSYSDMQCRVRML